METDGNLPYRIWTSFDYEIHKNPCDGERGRGRGECISVACQLSKENNARLYALHIIEVKQELPLDAEVDAAQGESVLSRIEAVGKQKKCKVEAGILQARHAGPAIVQEATERETGLIILGISFKRRFGEFTLGDTVSYVSRTPRARLSCGMSS